MYEVGYYYQELDDNGCPREGYRVELVDYRDVPWWMNAMGGKRIGSDYINVDHIKYVSKKK